MHYSPPLINLHNYTKSLMQVYSKEHSIKPYSFDFALYTLQDLNLHSAQSTTPQQHKTQQQQRSCHLLQHLRQTLAQKLHTSPNTLVIQSSRFGKKWLQRYATTEVKTPNHSPLHFSISHTGLLSAYVLNTKPIGLDVEAPIQATKRRYVQLFTRMLSCFCQATIHSRFLKLFLSLSPSQRNLGLTRMWCTLEAITKLHGRTLWQTLRTSRLLSPNCLKQLLTSPKTQFTIVCKGYQLDYFKCQKPITYGCVARLQQLHPIYQRLYYQPN